MINATAVQTARQTVAAIAGKGDHIDASRAVKALCEVLGLDIYWGTGYAIEGDHAVIIVREGETFGHLNIGEEVIAFWYR